MVNVEERYQNYLRFLNTLYDSVGGSPIPHISMWDIGEKIGTGRIPSIETQNIAHWLKGEGLIDFRANGGLIGLTHQGIKEVEEARLHPDKDTVHFSPSIIQNVINIHDMHNSVIQQGNIESAQNVILNETQSKAVLELLSELKMILQKQESSEQKEELEKEVQMLEIEASSKKPRKQVVKELLSKIGQKVKEYAPLASTALKIGATLAMLV